LRDGCRTGGTLTVVDSAPHLRRFGIVIVVLSAAAIVAATMFPGSNPPIKSHLCVICGSLGGVDALLNVALFLPLGLGLALSRARRVPAITGMCLLSAVIELAQLLFIPGRDATLGDLVMNSTGGVAGFALGSCSLVLTRPSPRQAVVLAGLWSILWLGIQSVSAYSLVVAAPNSIYYGQLNRRLGGFVSLDGNVLNASVGTVAIPDQRLGESDQIRSLLEDAAPVTVRFALRTQQTGTTALVRLADTEQREVALLAIRRDGLLFGVRTGATRMRLRPLLFAAENIVPGSNTMAGADTLLATGVYSQKGVEVDLTSRMTTLRREIGLSPAIAWTTILPFQFAIEGSRREAAVGMLWVGVLLVPFGYWLAWAAFGYNQLWPGRVAAALLAASISVTIGFVWIPSACGVGLPQPRDWIAAAAGIAVGAALRIAAAPRYAPNRVSGILG
jgi:VanZ like protein